MIYEKWCLSQRIQCGENQNKIRYWFILRKKSSRTIAGPRAKNLMSEWIKNTKCNPWLCYTYIAVTDLFYAAYQYIKYNQSLYFLNNLSQRMHCSIMPWICMGNMLFLNNRFIHLYIFWFIKLFETIWQNNITHNSLPIYFVMYTLWQNLCISDLRYFILQYG